ncbi:MIP/aquaporin family protein [Arthrobacter sp. ISL-30]|uniref:MIP/aquaporin family protein n=1 Tax=Arthrobacter sp. ISL-30 TaxID=2819109 RepID=UPI001BE7FA3C|nr:aquaporin [Arthrobacter sp. ISL-30]MBT2513995.1 aquaporin [Arthrobacter sp. ISL-30]
MTTPVPSIVRGPGLAARLSAEALGTLFLVIAALGVPLFTIPQSNPLPAALAAGLAVTAAMLAFAHVSGGHFNPAITLGNLIAGRISPLQGAAYLGAQLIGAMFGALTLFGVVRTIPAISDSRAAFDTVTAGFGEHSSIQAPMAGVLLLEVVGAALLVAIFLGTSSPRTGNRMAAPFAVGLTLAVLLQIGQSIGNAPFNPARATASALFSSSWALEQLWLFWIAPLVGAAVAGLVFRGIGDAASPAAAKVASDRPEPAIQDADQDDFGVTEDGSVTKASDAGTSDAGALHGDASPSKPADSGTDEARDFFDGKRN